MLTTEGHQVRQPGHGAIFLGQLAQYSVRFEPGELHQIDGRFGVTTAGQHPTRAGAQREDMAGSMQVGGPGSVGDGRADGGDAIGGGHPGGHPLRRFDGHGEGSLIVAGVGLHHHRQLELANPLVGQTEADDAGALADHHGHLLVGHGFCGKDEIAFVLAIFIIGHQHTLTGTQGGQRGFDASNGITEFTE